jgi:hypothetical protein
LTALAEPGFIRLTLPARRSLETSGGPFRLHLDYILDMNLHAAARRAVATAGGAV